MPRTQNFFKDEIIIPWGISGIIAKKFVISSEVEKSSWFSWQISPLPPVGRNDRKSFRSVEMTNAASTDNPLELGAECPVNFSRTKFNPGADGFGCNVLGVSALTM